MTSDDDIELLVRRSSGCCSRSSCLPAKAPSANPHLFILEEALEDGPVSAKEIERIAA